MSDPNHPGNLGPTPTDAGIDPLGTSVIGPPTTLPDEDTSYSQGRLVLRRFLRHKGAMIALGVLVAVVLLAFTSIGFGPFPGWWSKSYVTGGAVVDGGRPTLGFFHLGEHPFGQDNVGKDYFALVMRGTQRSLIIAMIIGLVSTFIGTLVGSLAGYYRGWVESLLMRVTDLFIVVPLLVIAAVVGQMVSNRGIMTLAFFLGILTWTGLARLVRGEVLSLREREFVVAARAAGASSVRVVVKHILPNTVGVVIVSATLMISAAILLETSLSYLGFGVKPPDTSLGSLISDYEQAFRTRPWLFWWPGIFILTIALCVNFIGDGLRDAFDPRQTREKD